MMLAIRHASHHLGISTQDNVMALQINKSIVFPEEYIIEEDLKEMGESNPHTNLIEYLKDILQALYQLSRWLVISEMNVYHPAIRNSQHYIVPDVTLVKIVLSPEEEQALSSWDAERMAPQVVFEVASKGTWPFDVRERATDKPAIYGRIGVREYFTYDPHFPQVWTRNRGIRLRGWRYEDGQPIELQLDVEGRLWSEELNSYLVPDGYYLRLTDREGLRRLTDREIDFQKRLEAEQRAIQLEAERQAEHSARLEAERQIAELQRQLEELRRQQGEDKQ